MTYYIFYTILIIFISIMSVSAYIINNKYKRLSKKEKQSLEKSLKKMGFFILVILLLSIPTCGETYTSNDRGLYPVVVPADALSPAEDTVEELTYNTRVLLDETAWRLGIKNFLNIANITNSTNSTNPMEVMIS